MTINYQQWRKVLSTVNSDNKLDKRNVIEKVKDELKASNEEVFKQWEESNFYVNYKFEVGDNEFTLLHLTAKLGYTSLTKALIVKKGIDVNIKDKNKKTPLHLALMNGHADVVYSLVRNGADINIQDEYGMPPAFLAIRRDYVFTLPKKREGLHVNAKNHDRLTSSKLAKEEKQPTSAIAKGFFAGSAIALSGVLIAKALSASGIVTVESTLSTSIAVVKTAAIALVVGSTIYGLSKPDTQVDKSILTNRQQETAGASRVA